jgi:hypothetical protein
MWLPEDLVRKILEMADLSIDTRLAFGLVPKRMSPRRVDQIEILLKSHDGLFYDVISQSLHNFRIEGTHIIRRPIELSSCDDGLTIFNINQGEYALEIYTPAGEFMFDPRIRGAWYTEMRVISW